jgi:hypothetical protein
MAKLLYYQKNNSVYFAIDDGVNPVDYTVGTYPPNSISIKIDTDGETLTFSHNPPSGQPREIIKRRFDEIADENGTVYSIVDAPAALLAINLAVGQFATTGGGGGGGGATAAKQDDQTAELVNQTAIQGSTLPSIRTSNLDIANSATLILNALLGGTPSQEFVQAVLLGLIPGVSGVVKAGFNPDVDIITAPNYQLIGAGGGSYTGFVATDNNIQVVSSSASDVGNLYVQYLANANSTEYVEGIIPVTGTTPSNAFKAYRIHTAYYVPTNGNIHNLGTITVRQVATPTNIFLIMLPFVNQTNTGVYTVPKGKKALVLSPTCTIGGSSTSAYAKVALFRKATTATAFRQQQPLLVAFGAPVEGQRNGGLLVGESTDLAFTATSCSANNTEITFSLTILIFPA